MIFRWLLRRKMRRSIFGKYVTPEGIDEIFVDSLSEWGCLLSLLQLKPLPKNDGRPVQPWSPGSNLIAIADGISLPEAHILRGRLQAEDIFAAVIGEHDFESRLIRVLVRERDATRALEIRNEGAQSEPNSN